MALITLDAIELPEDLEWTDEYTWTPVTHAETYAVNGALIVEPAAKQSGRPITLVGGPSIGWIDRATVEALQAKYVNPGLTMTLTLADARVFTVAFRHAKGAALKVNPVYHLVPAQADDPFEFHELALMEVDPDELY